MQSLAAHFAGAVAPPCTDDLHGESAVLASRVTFSCHSYCFLGYLFWSMTGADAARPGSSSRGGTRYRDWRCTCMYLLYLRRPAENKLKIMAVRTWWFAFVRGR